MPVRSAKTINSLTDRGASGIARVTKRIPLLVSVICVLGLTGHVTRSMDGHLAGQAGYVAQQACRTIIKERFPETLTFGTPTVTRPYDAYVVRVSARPTDARNDDALHRFECVVDMGEGDVVRALALHERPIDALLVRW